MTSRTGSISTSKFDEALTELIDEYVHEFRPVLLRRSTASWLFPGEAGEPKTASMLSTQITKRGPAGRVPDRGRWARGGRIFLSPAAPEHRPLEWTLNEHNGSPPTFGYEPTQDAALAAFTWNWAGAGSSFEESRLRFDLPTAQEEGL
jgi:hypothetical protein